MFAASLRKKKTRLLLHLVNFYYPLSPLSPEDRIESMSEGEGCRLRVGRWFACFKRWVQNTVLFFVLCFSFRCTFLTIFAVTVQYSTLVRVGGNPHFETRLACLCFAQSLDFWQLFYYCRTPSVRRSPKNGQRPQPQPSVQ